jgi:hypothetical protein
MFLRLPFTHAASKEVPIWLSYAGSVLLHAIVLIWLMNLPSLTFRLYDIIPILVGDSERATITAGISSLEELTGKTNLQTRRSAQQNRYSPSSEREIHQMSNPNTIAESRSTGLGQIADVPGDIAMGEATLGTDATGLADEGTSRAPSGQLGTMDPKGGGGLLGRGGPHGSKGDVGISPGKSSAVRDFPIPPIVVPESIRGTNSPFESEVYADADRYVLFAPEARVGVAVPGNEVCLDSDQIRTIQPAIFQQRVTDESKCETLDYGDSRQEICAPDAHTTKREIIHLSSPVNYAMNVCQNYDRSNCEWRIDGESEKLICKDTRYPGIWAASTQFHYRCAKSASQELRHALQYEVRFIQDVEFPGQGFRRRLVLKQARSLTSCH